MEGEEAICAQCLSGLGLGLGVGDTRCVVQAAEWSCRAGDGDGDGGSGSSSRGSGEVKQQRKAQSRGQQVVSCRRVGSDEGGMDGFWAGRELYERRSVL